LPIEPYRLIFISSFILSLFTFLVPVIISIFHSLQLGGLSFEDFTVSYVNLKVHISENLILAYKILMGISFLMSVILVILFIDKRRFFRVSILCVIMSIFYPIGSFIFVLLAFTFG
jgi:hypothetical protein